MTVLGFMLLLHASVTQTLTLAWGPRVLRKFTYLRLSSLRCYICPCISNQALCQQNVLGIQCPIHRFAHLLCDHNLMPRQAQIVTLEGISSESAALRDITSRFKREHSSPPPLLLMIFVTVARKQTLEFTPAWLPVPVGRPVGVECSQSKVKPLCMLHFMHNEQRTFPIK